MPTSKRSTTRAHSNETVPDGAASQTRDLDSDRTAPYVLLLAGGEGTRLRSVTRALSGDDRPKQFCAVVGSETLLEKTERRAGLIAPPERTLLLLARHHEAYYRDLVSGVHPSSLVIQPGNRGTAAAVLYGLLRIAARTPNAPVVILPSDHWVSDESAFRRHVEPAVGIVEAHEDLVVLLGTVPTRPEPDYGWIEPGEPIIDGWRDLHRVARLVEKPPMESALRLYRSASYWNTSVVVGQLEELLFLFAMARPHLVDTFLEIWSALGSPEEGAAADRMYARLSASDFSRDVLATQPQALAVLAVTGVLWEDLGSPARIREARRLELLDSSSRGAMPCA